ncbi:hypothetical protein ACL6C3_18030 [Capilliphycus salinus ALCB114379]|uniref:hypothetical protein n=1 Tax=Capilliphycus salinus TaxID=2768948 RepID=UPI0039A51143
MPITFKSIPTFTRVVIATIFVNSPGAIAGGQSSFLPKSLAVFEDKNSLNTGGNAWSLATNNPNNLEKINPLNPFRVTSEQRTNYPPTNNNEQLQAALPEYCSPDEYKIFFEHFVRGQDYQGNETRFTHTADTIEVRDYENPSNLIGFLSKKDDEFSIDIRDYRWVQLVPSSVDNSPYTRLQVDLKRINNNTFRVDYIKAEYAYDSRVDQEEYVVRTYGEPGAYIFEHRNGCWTLIQKLQ